jgi:hypothetical protein
MFKMALMEAKDTLDVMCEYYRNVGVDTTCIEDPTFQYASTLRSTS